MKIISYCNNKYPNSFGGVARFDFCLSLITNHERVFFKGPEEINDLLEYYQKNKGIIITDNHLSSQISKDIPLIVVHHGVARTHAEREKNWDEKWKNLCVRGQDLMFHLRKPKNTIFVSPTIFCKNEFSRIYGKIYSEFPNYYLPHASELDESKFKMKLNEKPIILGNWSQDHKGKNLISELIKKLPEFEFRNLKVDFKNKSIDEFNNIKQKMYIDSDIYLCLSIVEGSSYSVLDAMLNNLLIVSTDVGIMENEVDKNSFVSLSWKNLEVDYICKKIKYIWKKREKYFNKSREEYFKLTNFDKWKHQWNEVIDYFNLKYING